MNIRQLVSATLPGDDRYRFGIADLKGLLNQRYRDYRYAVSLTRRLDEAALSGVNTGPTRAYREEYRSVNLELEATSTRIAETLQDAGIPALAIHPTFDDMAIDAECARTLRSPFSHKMAATRAGLGWIGKTDLLITTHAGPRVRLVTVLFDHGGTEANTPITESRCGNCRICVDTCPGKVAAGGAWNTTIDRDEFFDAHRCRATCRELSRERLQEEISICGICVAVCPVGKK